MNKRKRHKKFIQKDSISIAEYLLGALAVSGVISIAIFAPNALQAIPKIFGKKPRRSYINKKLKNLIDSGFVESNKGVLSLTEKGERQLEILEEKDNLSNSSGHWDGRFRFVVFDIKEINKKARDLFRYELESNGFRKIQNSVWASKIDCENLIRLISIDLNVDKNIIFIESDKVSGNYDLTLQDLVF